MSNRLELPDDLISLVEKREQDDRRQANDGPPAATGERRSGADRRDDPSPASPANDPADRRR